MASPGSKAIDWSKAPVFQKPSNPFSWENIKYQVSGAAVRDGFNFITGGDADMGVALAGEVLSLGKSLFKRKAKKVASRVASNVATGLVSDAIGSGIKMGIQRYTGGGPQLPPIPPANFGGSGTNFGDVLNTGVQLYNSYTGKSGGTAIQRHPGAVALPDGTIWYHGHLYIYRQTASGGRMQRVVRDRRSGAIVPAPKHMNVLNPHALSRSMRRVEGFHRVASSAIKHMEKWARKTSHKRAPVKQIGRGKK